jgi:hypothetical protein
MQSMTTEREECGLLRAIARTPSAAADGQIRSFAGSVRDWDSLLRIANEHHVLPLLYSRLLQSGTTVAPEVEDRLHSAYRRNAFHGLANAAELITVLKAFDPMEIAAMPFKGVVLAAAIYGDLTMRHAGDLDILIHLRDRARAAAVLLELGYELRTPVRPDGAPADPDCYEYHFERPSDGMVTELRWRFDLARSKFRHDLGMDWVWPNRRTTMLAGAEVPDVEPEILLLMLSMHGSKHRWSKLLWICDVARLLASRTGLDWRMVIQEAKRTGLWRSVALGVLLANRVAGAEVASEVLERFESDRTASRMARHIEEHLFDAPGVAPEGVVTYGIQLLGFRDRVGLVFSLDLLRPNERDRAVLELPRQLRGLYYLIRPFRILRDRSPR